MSQIGQYYVAITGQSNARSLKNEGGDDVSGHDVIENILLDSGQINNVVISNYAVGGSAVDGENHSKPDRVWWNLSENTPGVSLIAAVAAINDDIAANNIDTANGDVASIMWAQGEADASLLYFLESDADRYKAATLAVFDYMRDNINADIEIYFSLLGRYNYDVTYSAENRLNRDTAYEAITDKQLEIIRENDFVHLSAYNARHEMTDIVHYTNDSYEIIAADVATAMLEQLTYTQNTTEIKGDDTGNLLTALTDTNTAIDGLGGADTLVGQAGFANIFTVSDVTHSTVLEADIIQGFISGEDIIDLSALPYNDIRAGSTINEHELLLTYDAVTDVTTISDDVTDFALLVEGEITRNDVALTADPLVQQGTTGADTLVGGQYFDTLTGYEGADELSGGQGSDVFKIFEHDHSDTELGQDTITDFDSNADVLDFTGLGYHALVSDNAVSGELEHAYDAVNNITTLFDPNGTFGLTINGDHALADIASTIIFGEVGQEIFGTDSSEKIGGTNGNDTIVSGAANDGNFKDFIYTGLGRDVIKYNTVLDSLNDQEDRISDFVLGTDIIDVSALGFDALTLEGENYVPNTLRVSYHSTRNQMYLHNLETDFRILIYSDFTVEHDPYDVVTGLTGFVEGESRLVEGTDGNDTLYGGTADDTIIGSLGTDYIYGGDGADTIIYNDANESYDDAGDRLRDFVEGMDVIDVSALGFEGITLPGEAYVANTLQATYTTTLNGLKLHNPETDFRVTISGDFTQPNNPANFVIGLATSTPEEEPEDLPVNDDPTVITGTDASETIYGSAGDDSIIGSLGTDYIFGGDGADTVVYSDPNQSYDDVGDRLRDFVEGVDVIDVSALGFDGLTLPDETYVANTLHATYTTTLNGLKFHNPETGFRVTISGDFTQPNNPANFVIGLLDTESPEQEDPPAEDPPADDPPSDEEPPVDNNPNIIIGTDAGDTIYGTVGDDTITGGLGRDYIYGNGGNNTFVFNDVMESQGQDGDRLRDFVVGQDTIDLTDLGFSVLTLPGQEYLEGTLRVAYNDDKSAMYLKNHETDLNILVYGDFTGDIDPYSFITGLGTNPAINDNDQLIIGTDASDALIGGAGNDTIDGSGGKDSITTNAGNDTIIFSDKSHSTTTQRDYITDFVVGEDVIDLSIMGYHGVVTQNAAPGELRISYSANSDRTYLRDDYSDFEFYLQGDYRDTLSPDDFIFATDALNIIGTDGNDILRGSVGDDTIDGASGADRLYGGEGADIFVFSDMTHSVETAKDRIMDFTIGEDIIDLSALGYTTLVDSNAVLGELRISYSANSDRTYLRDDYSEFELFLQGDYSTTLTVNDINF